MPSALYPNNPGRPRYGNIYVYDPERATDYRMNEMVSRYVKEDLLKTLGEKVAQNNVFAKAYRHMDELIKEQQEHGISPWAMRMKLIDARGVDPQDLVAHPGVYEAPRCGDMISVYFTCGQEMNVPQKGYIVYPKKDKHIPFEMRYFLPLIDAFCFPLLNGYGEDSHKTGIPYQEEKKPYFQRMVETKSDLASKEIEIDWNEEEHNREEIPPGAQVQMEEIWRQFYEDSSNDKEERTCLHLEDDEDSDESNEFVLEDDVIEDSFNTTEHVAIVERNGELYPQRVVVETSEVQDRFLVDDFEDSDDEVDFEAVALPEHVPADLPSTSRNAEQCLSVYDSSYLPQNTTDIDSDSDEHLISANLVHDYDLPSDEEELAAQTFEVENLSTEGHHHQNVSFRQHLFKCQRRKGWKNRFTASRKLGQFWLIDTFMRIIRQRGDGIRKNFTQTTTTTKKNFLLYMNQLASRRNRRIDALTYIPQHVPGSPRYLRQKFKNAVALSNKLGHPDLFITFTASAKWKEFKENIPKGETFADHPFLVAEVFMKKLKQLLKDICGTRPTENAATRKKRKTEHKNRTLKKGIFGEVSWYVYSIEFQQRGLPHAHIVISLADPHKPRTPEDIDKICQAELPIVPEDVTDPNYSKQKKLRELVELLMIHTPCEQNSNAYCRKNMKPHWKMCRKHFPKSFENFSRLIDDDYAVLRRPNNGECSRYFSSYCLQYPYFSLNSYATNQHVVAYNKLLLHKYQSHINVEIISNLRVLKYLYKYLFKGFNRALLETIERTAVDNGTPRGDVGAMTATNNILYPKGLNLPKGVLLERDKQAKILLTDSTGGTTDDNGQNLLVYDEVQMVEDLRAVTSCEAAWETSAYPMNGSSHIVATCYIHEPNGETLIIPKDQEEEVLHRLREDHNEIPSMLKAWFHINSHPPNKRIRTFTSTYGL
ncbi:hypothetical protein L596_012531 [Steinernema carpocapsae]|uniref:Helitron helicase-like domain-containing protein n=2 Tax=Steinernema carpocapsae TaxID=34508 RepID=A0A4U5NXY1_STECR|nr:hypothetical protein L596_012531 [Steinernema carpocapsae]